MKRILSVVLAAAVFFLIAALVNPALAAPVGTFTSVTGKTDITPSGGTAKQAGKGDPVNIGDIIRVKSKSRAEVAFRDGNVLRLAENTRLKITQYMFGKNIDSSQQLDLYRGKVRTVVNTAIKGAGRFEVHTPTAVAGVRGTDHFTWHIGGVSGGAFKKGYGYVYNRRAPDRRLNIGPGQAFFVGGPGLPPELRDASDLEMQQHERDTDPTGGPGSANLSPGQWTLLSWVWNWFNSPRDGQLNLYIPFTEHFNTRRENGHQPPQGPVVTLTPSLPVPVTGDDFISIGFSAPGADTFSYRIDGGAWTDTPGPDVDLASLAEGVHSFELMATNAAGDSGTASYQWFIGQNRYNVDGSVTGGVSGWVDPEFAQGIRLASGMNTGAWSIPSYSITPVEAIPETFSFVTGGSYDGDYQGLWMSKITGSSSGVEMAGTSELFTISETKMGSGTGTVQGIFTAAPLNGNFAGEAPNGWDWAMVDTGLNYVETDLTFCSSIDVDTKYFQVNGDPPYVEYEGFFGLMLGGTGSLWASQSINFRGLGYAYERGSGPERIWLGELSSMNPAQESYTTYDGGAFYGIIAGTAGYSGAELDRIEGTAALLYVDNNEADRKAGILLGSLSGEGYPYLFIYPGADYGGMVDFRGTLSRVELGDSPVQPQDLWASLDWSYFNYGSGFGSFTMDGDPGSGKIMLDPFVDLGDAPPPTQFVSMPGADWGIFSSEIYGRFGTLGPYNGWTLDIAGGDPSDNDAYLELAITGDLWADNRLSGAALGYWADIQSALGPATGVMSGKVLGTYETVDNSFQAVLTGAWLETNKLLSMIDTAGPTANVAALQALKIPCFEVGRATLSSDLLAPSWVTISNVIFLSSSAGGRPAIWASGSVNGVNALGASLFSVPVAGNGLSATFQINRWNDLDGTGTWMGTVTDGSGSISGGGANVQNLQFKGVAAGTFNGIVNFSGTAAGLAK